MASSSEKKQPNRLACIACVAACGTSHARAIFRLFLEAHVLGPAINRSRTRTDQPIPCLPRESHERHQRHGLLQTACLPSSVCGEMLPPTGIVQLKMSRPRHAAADPSHNIRVPTIHASSRLVGRQLPETNRLRVLRPCLNNTFWAFRDATCRLGLGLLSHGSLVGFLFVPVWSC